MIFNYSASRALSLSSIVLVGVAMTACTSESDREPIRVSHEAIQLNAPGHVRDNVNGFSRSVGFINRMTMLDYVPIFGEVESGCHTAIDSDGALMDDPYCEDVGAQDRPEINFEEEAVAWADFVAERVLRDTNLEDSDEYSVTYRLGAELLCQQQASGGADPLGQGPEPGNELPIDPECADWVQRFPVRFVVTSPREGDFNVDLLLGEARINPLMLQVWDTRLAIEVDLAELKRAAEAATEVRGEALDLPEVVAGRVAVRLERRAGGVFEASLHVLERINIVSVDLQNPILFSMEAASPLMRLNADGRRQQVTLETDASAIDIKGPLAMFLGGDDCEDFSFDDDETPACGRDNLVGSLAMHLAGINSRITLSGEADRLTVENIGLGDETSTVAYDGTQVVAVDLNADGARRLQAEFVATADGLNITVSPELDFQIALDLRYLAGQLDVQDWTLDEDIRVRLADAGATVRFGEGFEIVSGELILSSSAYGTLSATGGMCLTRDTDDAAGDGLGSRHPFEGLAAETCGQ